jgi:hypothetical protein
MALELRYVDRIHTRLLARYGSKWINLYAGVDADMVKADWCEQLARVQPDAIRYALDNLPPDSPPNVGQFRALCNRRPSNTAALLLAAPTEPPQPERVAAIVGKLADKPAQVATPAQQCYDNIMRIARDRGGKLSAAQRRMIEAMQAAGLIEVTA